MSADMVKESVVVNNVRINRGEDGKLRGDVDFDAVAPKFRHLAIRLFKFRIALLRQIYEILRRAASCRIRRILAATELAF